MRQITDLGRRRYFNKDNIERATGVIAAAADMARAIVDAKKKQENTMSILDKLDLVVTRRLEHDKALSDGADKLLERYAASALKAERAFDKHHARLDAEDEKLHDTDNAIERMSNSVGNSTGSEQSSEQQSITTADVAKVA